MIPRAGVHPRPRRFEVQQSGVDIAGAARLSAAIDREYCLDRVARSPLQWVRGSSGYRATFSLTAQSLSEMLSPEGKPGMAITPSPSESRDSVFTHSPVTVSNH